jgi:hypothetical protein
MSTSDSLSTPPLCASPSGSVDASRRHVGPAKGKSKIQPHLPGMRGHLGHRLPEPTAIIDTHAFIVTIPGMRLVNPTNEHAHWRVRHRRAKEQRSVAAMVCRSSFGSPPLPPLRITITLVGPGTLDSDSLPASAKHVRDGIADWLQVDDGSPLLEWVYAQNKGGRGEYAATIRIESAQDRPEERILHNAVTDRRSSPKSKAT